MYRNIVQKYGRATGINAEVIGLCAHSLRATAATNELSHEADIEKCRNGLAMLMSRRRTSTTGANAARGQPDFSCEILRRQCQQN